MSKKKKVRIMDRPKIIPRGDQILIKPVEEEARISEFGIITPNTVEQERKAIGVVIAVGPKVTDVKKGDNVIYGAFAGERIAFAENAQKVEYVLLFDEDVLAFIEIKLN